MGEINPQNLNASPVRYSTVRKIRPFLRGLASFSPLHEVAKEGLRGRYELDAGERRMLAMKLAVTSIYYKHMHEILEILRNGCSEEAQEILTGALRRFVKVRELHAERPSNLTRPRAVRYYAMTGDFHASEASDINNLCANCLSIYSAGSITSQRALQNLDGSLIRLPKIG